MKSKENLTISFFKAIACLCVVAIYAPLPRILGGDTYTFRKFAVPFFFMVTGYFVKFDNNSFKYRFYIINK